MNSDYDIDYLKVPPHAVTAEQAVLGALILSSNKIDDVSGLITADDFYRSNHSIIFNEVVLLGADADVVTLSGALDGKGLLDTVGGMGYLVELTRSVTSTANIKTYAAAIKDKSRQRALLASAEKIAEIAYDPELTTEQKISDAQSCLMSMESHQGEEAAQANSAIKEVIDEIDLRFTSGGAPIGIQTGFKAIDERIGGIRNQNLFILAARPAMGKTTLAMNIAENLIRKGTPVLVFSAEMSRSELMERMVASSSNIKFERIRRGTLEDEDWPKLSAGVSHLKDKPLYIDDRGGLSIEQIQSSARKQKQKHGIKFIIVDYLQLLSSKGQSREQEVSSISRGLKSLAKELDVPILALSQLSRKCEERKDKRPMPSDLRDSGAIEQDADIIAFIYRDEVYDENSERKGIAEIIFSKARNFSVGTDCLATKLDVSRFDDLSFEPPPISQTNVKGGGFNYE
jgi:replicative DNA helicase